VKLLPCGDAGLLVEVDGLDEVLDLHAALEADPPAGVVDLVPAARTVLVRIDPGQTTVEQVTAAVRSVQPGRRPTSEAPLVELPVTYDGADLDEVGVLTGLGRAGVVAAHTGQPWTVAFVGFAPGFGYLVGEDARLHVARRSTPRTRVPAGAVGLAGEFSGVYPRPSPGGWQLIGRTDVALWDLARDPPALLVAGTRVRFTQVG
jgi:KipI family sensor histidine kinase inhibitor